MHDRFHFFTDVARFYPKYQVASGNSLYTLWTKYGKWDSEGPLMAMSTTASNVTSLLLGLHAPHHPLSQPLDADQSPSLI